jgi:hypothetical protein
MAHNVYQGLCKDYRLLGAVLVLEPRHQADGEVEVDGVRS